MAISKPTAIAPAIDKATAATGFTWRGALLIGTIHSPYLIAMHLARASPRRCGGHYAPHIPKPVRKDDEPKRVNEKLMSATPVEGGQLADASVGRAFAGKSGLHTRACLKLIGIPILIRTSPDVRAIQDVLTPFIDLDDGNTHRDDEGEKYDCLDDHF